MFLNEWMKDVSLLFPSFYFQKHLTAQGIKGFLSLCLVPQSWTVACQAPLPVEFSRQEHKKWFHFPSPCDLPDPGMEAVSLESPALAGGFFTTSTTWEAHYGVYQRFSIQNNVF